MGTYDYIVFPIWKDSKLKSNLGMEEEIVQVKCWASDFTTYHMGDSVPPIKNQRKYSIIVPEGYIIFVRDLTLVTALKTKASECDSSLSERLQMPVYDKWGNEWTSKNTDLLSGP